MDRFVWTWLLPAALVGLGLAFGVESASAYGIGLAAALSLSSSI
jgi:hypothetical protein